MQKCANEKVSRRSFFGGAALPGAAALAGVIAPQLQAQDEAPPSIGLDSLKRCVQCQAQALNKFYGVYADADRLCPVLSMGLHTASTMVLRHMLTEKHYAHAGLKLDEVVNGNPFRLTRQSMEKFVPEVLESYGIKLHPHIFAKFSNQMIERGDLLQHYRSLRELRKPDGIYKLVAHLTELQEILVDSLHMTEQGSDHAAKASYWLQRERPNFRYVQSVDDDRTELASLSAEAAGKGLLGQLTGASMIAAGGEAAIEAGVVYEALGLAIALSGVGVFIVGTMLAVYGGYNLMTAGGGPRGGISAPNGVYAPHRPIRKQI